ncbi:hypothetical protein ACFW04_014099 [Cataglyphis niger]
MTGNSADTERPRPVNAETTQDEPMTSADAISRLKLPLESGYWFAQIEMAFDLERIISDDRKFKKNLIMWPPRKEKYETLKIRVLNACYDFAEDDVRRFLRGLSFGDDKQLTILNAKPKVSLLILESYITCREILAYNDTTDLSKFYDTSGSHGTIGEKSTKMALISSTRQLKCIIEEMNTDDRRNCSRSKTPQRRRTYSHSKTHAPAGRKNKNRTCFYHRKFAHEARNCTPPCEFVQKPENASDSCQ